jgi:hypothetical protein
MGRPDQCNLQFAVKLLGTVLLKLRYMKCTLTSDDQTTLGGTQSCLSGEAMFCSTLIRLITIFRSNITYMKLSRWQHQVLSICKHIKPLYPLRCTHSRQHSHRPQEHSGPSWTVRKVSLSITSALLNALPKQIFLWQRSSRMTTSYFMAINNELTPCSLALLTVLQLVKKLPEFYDSKFVYHVQKS